ncbi:MAG: hypothetical protein ACO3PV_06845 [Pseudohongiellaceae bacterium]
MGIRSTARTLLPALLLAAGSGMAQEHPDLSGAWTSYRAPAAAGAPPAAAPQPKFKPEAKAAAAAYRALIDGTNYAPGNACVGYGMPEFILNVGGGYPMEIIQRPEQVLILNELHNELRRLYLPGEARDPERFFPERNGYSTAQWQGERLVVQTSRLKTQVDTRYPHSNAATVREEFYLDAPLPDGTKVLAVDLVLEDPLWLEEPYHVTRRWQALPDYHVRSYECNEPKWLDEMEQLYEQAGLEMVQE